MRIEEDEHKKKINNNNIVKTKRKWTQNGREEKRIKFLMVNTES